MKQNISFGQFCDAFRDMDRNDNFTYAGKRALFDYLENLEADTGSEVELDVIALCCDYSEYSSAWDAMEEYQPDDMPVEGEEGDDLLEVQEKNEKAAHEWLEERTQVIDVEGGGVIIQAF
jgi:hypothetical protein